MKNKVLKTIVSSLLIVIMLFTAVPITASAATSGECGDNLTWTLNQSTGELVISGEGEMYGYGEIRYWEDYYNDIKSVVICNGVTTISYCAFSDCANLTSITIPDSVTTIGESAFEGCASLISISVSSENQYYSTDSYGVLYNKDKTTLIQYSIGNERTYFKIPASVKTVEDYAFAYCSNLTNVTIPDSVKTVGEGAFYYCDSLTSITLPNSVATIENYAFAYCSNLTNVTIPDSVKTVGEGAFYYCDSLTSITLPKSVVTIEDYVFGYCASLTAVVIPEDVTSIGVSAFESCGSLTSITIPDSVTTIGSYAFDYCISLTNIKISNSVTTIGNRAFNNSGYYNDLSNWKNGILYIGKCLVASDSEIVTGSYFIKDGTITIGNDAFAYCSNLTNVTIPASVKTVGEGAFYCCDSLTSITLPNSIVTIEDYVFGYCASLTAVVIPENVTSIGVSAFEFCGSLTSITIPDSVTTIGSYAFESCSGLARISLPDSVTTIGYRVFSNTAYYNNLSNWEDNALCIDDYLVEVKVGASGVFTVKKNVRCVAEQAFSDYNCNYSEIYVDSENQFYSSDSYGVLYNKNKTKLIRYPSGNTKTYFEIPESVTCIEKDAFLNCETLTNIMIPTSIKVIPENAFSNCYKLQRIEIPYGVASIGDGAFSGCIGLKEITMPNTVTYIGNCAFLECDLLSNVYYSGAAEQWEQIYIDPYGDGNGNLPLKWANIHFEQDIKNPVFEVYKVGEEGGTLTVNIDLTSNSFNSLGVVFNMYGVKCKSIEKGQAIKETEEKTDVIFLANPSASNRRLNLDITAIDGMEIGNIAIVTLEIVDEQYSFSIEALDCVVTREKDGKKENVTVEPEIFGVVSGERADEPEIYTITYNANGGSNAPASQTKTENVSITLSKSTPTRSGYTFLGWSTNKNATVAQYKPGATFSTNANTTLYAVWSKEEIYNLGEETYSFDNFGDSDSPGGHCFGMSMTSAGYYLNELDIKDIGLNSSSELYTASETAKVKKPICHYQDIQGTYSRDAIVAGGTSYKYGYYNISSDWNEVVNYVKNHNYDDTGTLQIGLRKSSQGGHAINFLRYENVNGEDRIYAYDNNFPNTETYFCKGSDGKVYQKPYSTFSGAIDCIALRSVAKYFDLAGDFDSSRVIYGWADTIEVEGVTGYPMDLGGSGEYMMYEIPNGVDEVIIVPLTDNATFEYMNEDYQFGGINEETYGVFTLSTSESSNDESFVIENEQSSVDEVFVYNLDMVYKSYAWIDTEIYATGNIDYTVEYSSSNPSVAYVDEFGEVYAAGEGSAEITCTVTDEYGNVVTDTCEVNVSYAWWQWIIRILLLGFLWY